MSSQQLKDLFEAGLAAPATDTVDVDAAIASGRRRRRLRVSATVLASAAAVVVAALLVAGLLPPRTTGSAGPGDGMPLPIPTSQWREGDDGMAALLKGVLLLRSDRCLVVVSPESETVIAWPAGFTAVQRDGGADVLGGDGSVVARTGEQISLGGGEGRVGVVGPCLGGPAPVFAVNQAAPYDRTPATATPAMWTPVQSAEELYGTWRPVAAMGRSLEGATDLSGTPLSVVFREWVDGSRLAGNDSGCNSFQADYTVGPDGLFSAGEIIWSAVGCPADEGTFPGAFVKDATRVELTSSGPRSVRFLASDGTVLAVLEATR